MRLSMIKFCLTGRRTSFLGATVRLVLINSEVLFPDLQEKMEDPNMNEPFEKIPSDENLQGDSDETDDESVADADILEFEEEDEDIEEVQDEEAEDANFEEDDEDTEEDKDNEGEGLEEDAEGENVSEEYVKLPILHQFESEEKGEEDNPSEK